MTYLRKIAFLVHSRSLLDHWYQIFLNLDKNKFDILVNDKNEYDHIRNHHKYNKFNIVRFDLSGELKKKYILSISPHFNGGTTSNILYYRLCKFFLKLSRQLKFNKTKILREFEAKINLVDLYVPLKIGIYNYRFSYGADIGEWETHLRNNFYDGFFIHGPIEQKIYRNYFKNKKYYELGYPRYHNFFFLQQNKNYKFKKKIYKR